MPSPGAPFREPIRCTGIPLIYYKSRPGSRVVVFFSSERGLIRFHTRTSSGTRKSSTATPSLFSTFDVLLSPPKKKTNLYLILEYQLRKSRYGLGSGRPLEPWAAASVLAETLLKTVADEDPHPYLFQMLEKGLDRLESGTPPVPLVGAFLVKYVEHMGFQPELHRCECGKVPETPTHFDLSRGVICDTCANRADRTSKTVALRREVLRCLEEFRLVRFESLDQTCWSDPSGESLSLIDLMGAYIEHHFEVPLKSLTFWHRLRN